jgi:hypothetical protein
MTMTVKSKKKQKPKVIKREKSKDYDFGQGATVSVTIGVSLAIPNRESSMSNIFTVKPTISLDAAPNKEKIEDALNEISSVIDDFISPRINNILSKIKRGGV